MASLKRADAEGRAPLYLLPCGLLCGLAARRAVAEGRALPLAGDAAAFTSCRLFAPLGREGHKECAVGARRQDILAKAGEWGAAQRNEASELLRKLTAARTWLGFKGGEILRRRTLVMGIVNVTPDSFSDGGAYYRREAAVAHGRRLCEEGADILDIGGESTRPGATPVAIDEEARRVLPVVRELAQQENAVPLSIDTRNACVMGEALKAGAVIVNDVSALTHDDDSPAAARKAGAVLLMHMKGTPQTMQDAPSYRSAAFDVYDYLKSRIEACAAAGIPRSRLMVDPGIGFGKTYRHNAELLASLPLFHGLGCPLMVGVSRKGFLAPMSGLERSQPARRRLPASLSAALFCAQAGVHMVRVHDVAATRQALAVWDALAATETVFAPAQPSPP